MESLLIEDSSINKEEVGLGLFICQVISKMLNPWINNKIKVESQFGKWTKFYFFLPFEKFGLEEQKFQPIKRNLTFEKQTKEVKKELIELGMKSI